MLHNQEKNNKRRRKEKIKELTAIQTLFRFAERSSLKKKDEHQRELFQVDPELIPVKAGHLLS